MMGEREAALETLLLVLVIVVRVRVHALAVLWMVVLHTNYRQDYGGCRDHVDTSYRTPPSMMIERVRQPSHLFVMLCPVHHHREKDGLGHNLYRGGSCASCL